MTHYPEKSRLFVTCAPTLEPLLLDELTELGFTSLQSSYCGVFVDDWDWNAIYLINYASRLASRVLLPLEKFRCQDRKSLYQSTMNIDWVPFFEGKKTFAIDANVQHRELRNSLYAAQVMKDAICDQLRQRKGRRPSIELQNPDLQLNLFIQHHMATISFDTSGEPLHKRGYRQESVEAPIQETLAAAILRLANYSSDRVFLDPCCGSGTFLIEAALIASETPPGYLRKDWGFIGHPEYKNIEWLKVRNQVDAKRKPLAKAHIFGIDRSQSAVRASKINLKAAGFSAEIDVQQADFRDYKPSVMPDMILANPPHGRRLDEEDQLRPLYRSLGAFMKNECKKSGHGFIFTSSPELAKEVGLASSKRHILSSGGVESRLLAYEISPS